MKRPFENKTSYDPGRFRFTIHFYQETYNPDGSGGQNPVFLEHRLTTRAVRESIREGSQIAINAGATILNEDCYFVIRNRPNFYPKKDMIVIESNNGYVIQAVIPIDVPVNYIKVLCVKRDNQMTT